MEIRSRPEYGMGVVFTRTGSWRQMYTLDFPVEKSFVLCSLRTRCSGESRRLWLENPLRGKVQLDINCSGAWFRLTELQA
jgi:hypothetical protein